MAQSGVTYFIENYASFDYKNYWKCYYSFKERSGNIITNGSGADSLYTGIDYTQNNIYDFINISGTGSRVNISPSTGLWSNNFTSMFLAEKLSDKTCSLFSCLETGQINNEIIYKGYEFGYTDGNKLYFSYYDNNGLNTLTTDFVVANKHSVYLNRTDNSITIGYYDFFLQRSLNNSFFINGSYLFEPDFYNIGINKSSNFSFNPSTGINYYTLDEFLYFNTSIYDYDIQIINSGWIADYIPPYTGSGIISYTGVTGYETGFFGTVSGASGINVSGTGLLTNEYGVQYTGYVSSNPIYNITGSGIIPLTGVVNIPNYFLIDETISINTGFLFSFRPNEIVMLRQIDSNDTLSLMGETGNTTWKGYNDVASYDSVRGQFKVFISEPLLLWDNGIAYFSGQAVNTGTIYNPKWASINDYYISGDYINSTGFFDGNDYVNYTQIDRVAYYIPNFSHNSGSVDIFPNSYSGDNTWVFFNGQKLDFGTKDNQYDYYAANPALRAIGFSMNQSLYQGATGTLSIVIMKDKYTQQTGSLHYLNTSFSFNPNFSYVFLNGQEQIPNIDYLVVSSGSLYNQNAGIFVNINTGVADTFNFNDQFFNI